MYQNIYINKKDWMVYLWDDEKGLSQFPEVEEIYNVAGEECLLLKARTTDPTALGVLLDNLRTVKGVTKTITSVVLSVGLDRGITPRIET